MADQSQHTNKTFDRELEVTRATSFIERNPLGTDIFCDTSALIYLAKVDLLTQLVHSYKLHLSLAVVDELLLEQDSLYPETDLINKLIEFCYLESDWTESEPVIFPDQREACLPDFLHYGERGVLRYYQSFRSGFLLTDDNQLMRFCKTQNIPFTSTILIPCLLYRYSAIDAELCQQMLHNIFEIGYFSERIFQVSRHVFRQLLSL